MKIDLHTHILPEKWPDLRERYGYGGFVSLEHHQPGCARMMIDGKCFREIQDNCWSPQRRMDECGPLGVQMQVISTVPVMFSYWAKPDHAADLATILNDHIAGVCRAHPRFFRGLGTLPMQSAELAIRELDRCAKDLALAGVQIGTNVNGRNLNDPQVFSVLERAAQLQMSVFVHPWDMLGQDRTERYWLRWLVGMPCETAVAICSIMFGAVLDRLPNLRMGFAHGGGSFAGVLGRVIRGYESRPDLCAVDGARHPREYLGQFYVDTLTHDESMLRRLMQLLGSNRIAVGSDYPFPLGEQRPGSIVENMEGLAIADRENLLFRSAQAFLGLPLS